MTRSSLRFRLTAAVVVLVAAALAALAVALYGEVDRAAWRQHDRALANRARAMTALAEYDDEDGYEFERPAEPAQGRSVYYQLWLPGGEVLARSPSLGEGDLPRAGGSMTAPFHAGVELPDGRPGRLVGIRFRPRDESPEGAAGELTLVLAEGIEDVQETLAAVRARFWLVGLPAILAVAVLAVWILSRGLRPLSRLADEIDRIDDRRLSARLPVSGQPAELEAPVRKLNELLARLDASFARERQFTADVSHELRTPLAGLRALLDVTALRERSGDEYRAALGEAREMVVHLSGLVESLLALVRLEGGQPELVVEDIPLRAFADECWRPYVARAVERRIDFRNQVDAAATIRSDRVKLSLVVGNLLSNAVEYTEAGGWVAVSGGQAAGGRDGVVVDVIDSGPPIPEDQLERIFDRLWRAEASRSAGEHFGIGLSLVHSVCRHLRLSVAAANLSDGTVRFRVTSS